VGGPTLDGGERSPAPRGAQQRRPRAERACLVEGADELPDEDAGTVEALEQIVGKRVLRAGRVRADRAQLRDDALLVGARQAVAVATRVGRQPGAPQPQQPAVEPQPPTRPRQLAQPD